MTRFGCTVAALAAGCLASPPAQAQVIQRDLLLGYETSSMNLDRYSIAGGGLVGPFATGGPGVTGYNYPAYGPDGSLYVAINNNPGLVLKFDGRTGGFISTFIPTS